MTDHGPQKQPAGLDQIVQQHRKATESRAWGRGYAWRDGPRNVSVESCFFIEQAAIVWGKPDIPDFPGFGD